MMDIIESKEVRNQLMERTDVLDRVKALFLIPEMEVMTTKQVADYFEIEVNTLKQVYKRNKEEIDSDGTMIRKPADFGGYNLYRPKGNKKGTVLFQMEDGTTFEVNNFGTLCFSRRAILRIAMLLRDSKVAQEVRTQLLNVFDNAEEETRIADIEDEQMILGEFVKALSLGDTERVLKVFCTLQQYHQRHITVLTEENEKLNEINKLLADGINTWDNRHMLNAMVRAASSARYNNNFKKAWNTYYKRLSYKEGIVLKTRNGNGKLIDRIKPNEWMSALQVAVAWLIELNIDVKQVINTTNAERVNV